MATTLNDIRSFIRTADVDQVDELYDMLHGRCSVLDGEAAFKFRVGDNVKFDAGRRGIITGTITEFKRNGRVGVRTQYGTQWRVSGRLLRAAADPRKPLADRALPAAGGDEF